MDAPNKSGYDGKGKKKGFEREGTKLRNFSLSSLPELRSNSKVIHEYLDSPRIFFNENSGNDGGA